MCLRGGGSPSFERKNAVGRGALSVMLILCLLLFSACGEKGPASPETGESLAETKLSPLSVRDGVLKDAEGEPFQLRGVSTHGVAWFPEYINASAFLSVKKAGGNAVRVAMYTDTENGYLADPERNLLLVRQAVENARALGLYVIVDWHILSDGDPNAHLSEAITFFDAVASAYRDEPAVLYEICNEPNGVGWDAVKTYAYAVIHVIRQYAPEAVILVGTPEYSSAIRDAWEDPLGEENLLYTYHYYTGEKGGFEDLREAVDREFPVLVSEWGVGKDREGVPALEEGREFAAWMNENGVGWCAWSLSAKDEVYSLLKPGCKKLGGFSKEDLTPVGEMVFGALEGAS